MRLKSGVSMSNVPQLVECALSDHQGFAEGAQTLEQVKAPQRVERGQVENKGRATASRCDTGFMFVGQTSCTTDANV
jgi:hypothetical protein